MKTKWLSFNIKMPSELIPLYDFLQKELNFILSDSNYRIKIESIDYSQHKGNVWRNMRDELKPLIKKWEIKNKTWYSYILFENIRREIQSKRENIVIFDELLKNNNKIDEHLFVSLVNNHGIYATRGRISNIKRCQKRPELPTNATLQLDYTISAKQNFTKDESNHCKMQLMGGSWIDYQILLPASLNGNLTGKVAKPRFMKRKSDGRYIGICSYEYIPEVAIGRNVLGVDIGQVKLFSAIALNENGIYSNEYVESAYLSKLNKKLSRLYNEKIMLYDKIQNSDRFLNFTSRQNRRREQYVQISNKIESLKKYIARLVAREIIVVAKKEECDEIHIENLSWMGSKGGKWNHSQVHKYIEEAGLRFGIKVIKVNAAYTSSEHPITKERGEKRGRDIEFSDGSVIDRDVLGAINLAVRNKGKKKDNKIIKVKKNHPTPKRTKRDKSKRKKIREHIRKIKGDMEIVIFSPEQLIRKSDRLWTLISKVSPRSSLLESESKYKVPINYNF